MRKGLMFILSIFMISSSIFSVQAAETISATNTGACDNDSEETLTEEEQKEAEAKIQKTIDSAELINKTETETGIMPYAAYLDHKYMISVSNYTQETNYYCGPAAVRQTLSFHKSKNNVSTSLPSQKTLASAIGTTTSGSTSSGIASGLNKYKTTFKIPSNYVATDILDKAKPYNFLVEAIKSSVSKQVAAPIVLIDTGNNYGIPQYKGVHIRHYNTISGLIETENIQNGDIAARSIRRVDPHYNSKYRGVYTNTYGEVYQAVEQADKNGTNKVLIY